MGLSSPGIGSNLDVASIVSQLMAVEQQPVTSLDKKVTTNKSKLSAVGSLKSALATFQTAAKAIADVTKLQPVTAKLVDATVGTATATATAAAGTYALEVSQLAQAQKLAAAGQATTTAAIGSGTISFDFGTVTAGALDANGKYVGAGFTPNGGDVKTVTIDPADTSLAGIRDAINKAKIGVTASIVNDGGTSPYRLVLNNSTTGETNSMRIAVSGDDALKTLLNHNPAGVPAEQGFSQTVAAQNAKFQVDGVAISKPTNVASDVIDGVTLTLTKTNVGTPTSFTVARDASAVTGAVGQFVFAFNTINQTIKDMTAYNAATKTGAVFSGDAAVRGIQSQLRGMLSTPVQGGSGAFTLLSQVGVTFQKDGTLAVDNTKLQAAVDSNFSDIAAVFAAVGSASDATVKYTGASAKTVAGAYAVNITQLATQGVSTAQAAPANLTIDDSNDTLQVLLDGVTATIKLAHDTYADPAALAAQMQSRINGTAAFTSAGSAVKVSVVGGNLTLTSNRFGSGSNVSISGGSGASNLMGATPVTAAGLDVAGTIGGVAATGSGRSLKGAAGSPAEGLSMEISALGNRGTVNYSQGYGSQYDKLLSSMLGTDGVLSARTEGLNATIKALGDQRTRLTDRLATIEQRYRAQFTALDTAISSMSTTSNFLTQQLNKINSM